MGYNILMTCRNKTWFKTFSKEKYILDKSCDGGSMIMNTKECKLACNDLGIPVFGKFKDRRPCFQGGNGMCMQNSGYGPKSKMLCTKKDTAEGIFLHYIV